MFLENIHIDIDAIVEFCQEFQRHQKLNIVLLENSHKSISLLQKIHFADHFIRE